MKKSGYELLVVVFLRSDGYLGGQVELLDAYFEIWRIKFVF